LTSSTQTVEPTKTHPQKKKKPPSVAKPYELRPRKPT